jgi:RecA-family ATPase
MDIEKLRKWLKRVGEMTRSSQQMAVEMLHSHAEIVGQPAREAITTEVATKGEEHPLFVAQPAQHLEVVASQRIISVDQLPSVWDLESQPSWLVENLLAEGTVNLFSSESGTGKTWFAYYLAGSIANGLKVLGGETKQRKTLYLDGENPLFVVQQRLDGLWPSEDRQPARLGRVVC